MSYRAEVTQLRRWRCECLCAWLAGFKGALLAPFARRNYAVVKAGAGVSRGGAQLPIWPNRFLLAKNVD
jgi:hypothetical protein